MSKEQQFHLGGQAVIEGVMMRSPRFVSIAVRHPKGEILVRTEPVHSLLQRYPVLNKFLIRGFLALFETLVLGIRALNYSANIALDEEPSGAPKEEVSDSGEKRASQESSSHKKDNLGPMAIASTMALAFALGIGLFVVLPNLAAGRLHSLFPSTIVLNLFEGGLRLAIFLAYLLVISLMPDIRRVFQYHGAEHKVVHATERSNKLSVENSKPYSTAHPRCGTSFLLVVLVVSLIVFAFLGWPVWYKRILSRMIILPLIAGISYEIIKFAGSHQESRWVRAMVSPGLWLQKMTAREPSEDQIEVALAAMRGVMSAEENPQILKG